MEEKRLYLRVRGKVMGPFDIQQLKSLRDRGQFRRFHEVSEDRHKWVAAATIPDFFPELDIRKAEQPEGQFAEPQIASSVAQQSPAVEASPVEWFYIDANGERRGPTSKDDLQKLWEKGEITPTTDVWKEGMADWLPISSAELNLEHPGQVTSASDAGSLSVSAGEKHGPDGLSAILRFLADPVGELPRLCQTLGAGGAMALALVFCLIFDVCLVLGFILTIYEIPRQGVGFGDLGKAIGNPPQIGIHVKEDKDFAKLMLILRFGLLALLPFSSLAIAITIIRTITGGSGNIGFDFLISGSALLPMGFLSPIAALLGIGNLEVILFLYVMMFCLTILILNSAFTRVIKLSDRGSILAIPSCLILTLWLFKVAVTAMIFR